MSGDREPAIPLTRAEAGRPAGRPPRTARRGPRPAQLLALLVFALLIGSAAWLVAALVDPGHRPTSDPGAGAAPEEQRRRTNAVVAEARALGRALRVVRAMADRNVIDTQARTWLAGDPWLTEPARIDARRVPAVAAACDRLREALTALRAVRPDGVPPVAAAADAWLAGHHPEARATLEAVARAPDPGPETFLLLAEIALDDGDPATARRWTSEGLSRTPDAGELFVLRMEANTRQAAQAARAGRRTAATVAYARAARDAQRAADLAPTDPHRQLDLARARLRVTPGSWLKAYAHIPNPRQAVYDAVTRAIALAPEYGDAYEFRGFFTIDALSRSAPGPMTPAPSFPAAKADLESALKFTTRPGHVWASLGTLYEYWLYTRRKVARPPNAELLRSADEAFSKAITLEPDFPAYLGMRASLRRRWAAGLRRGGHDPTEPARGAVADYAALAQRFPGDPAPLRAQVLSYRPWIQWLADHAQPRDAQLQAARDAIDRVLASPNAIARDRYLRACILAEQADAVAAAGRDPSAPYEAMLSDLDTAIRLLRSAPGVIAPESHSALRRWVTDHAAGLVHWGQALRRLARPAASERLAQGIAALDRLLTDDPRNHTAWRERGQAHLALAQEADAAGRPARAHFRSAAESFERAAQLDEAMAGEVATELAACRHWLQAHPASDADR